MPHIPFRTGLFALCCLALGACAGGPGKPTDLSQLEGVGRYSMRADTSAGEIDLSYLARLSTGDQRVIYVHGTPGSADAFLHMLSIPLEGVESLSVDRPGFGRTLPNRAVTSLTAQAESLSPLLDVPAGAPKPILVGHSLGGPVVAAAAALYPDRVGGIVVLAGSLDPDQEEVLWIQYLGLVPPFTWMLGREYKNANRELIALEGELKQLAARLPDITVPVEILHGTRDKLVPYDNVAFMERVLTGARSVNIVRLEGVNHFIPWSHVSDIIAAIDRLSPADIRRDTVNALRRNQGLAPLAPGEEAVLTIRQSSSLIPGLGD